MSSSLRLDYVRHDELATFLNQTLPADGRSVLGVACFGDQAQASGSTPGDAWPWCKVGLPVLHQGPSGHATADGPTPAVWEIWSVHARNDAVQQGRTGTQGALRYACRGDLMFAVLDLQAHGQAALHDVTRLAYQEIFRGLNELGYPHPLRLWNHLPNILAEDAGLERYRAFNAGRQDAFISHARSIREGAPAACALGYPPQLEDPRPFTLYLLAARQAPTPIENPRQVSAYHYPAQYGDRSPTFSRACWWADGPARHLFVSGTASIVGHESRHAGDVVAQTHETLNNIEALIAQAQLQPDAGNWAATDLQLKVYMRHAEDLNAVQRTLAQRWPHAQPLYLQAVVCRPDLLVEIEASACLGQP